MPGLTRFESTYFTVRDWLWAITYGGCRLKATACDDDNKVRTMNNEQLPC